MKKIYSLFKTRIVILAILSIGLIFNSCEKDDDENNISTTSSPTIFSLYVDCHESSIGNGDIDVTFTTSDKSVIPEVIVNGELIDNFWMDEGFYGWMEIPYSNTINYTISANGNTTSGSIDMPQYSEKVHCNEQELDVYQNYVDSASSYDISWQFINSDYTRFNCQSNITIYEILENTTTNYILPGSSVGTYFVFDLNFNNGARIVPGATPNITGDYGNGYVITEVYDHFSVSINSENMSQLRGKDIGLLKEQRKLEFISNFNELMKNMPEDKY